MRKLALLCLLLPLPLSAAVFSSNSIGQEISPKEMLDGSGYELEREGGVSTLYMDGNPVMVRTESDEGYTVESEGYEESVVISDGRRERSTIREGGRETSYTYFYDGDRLSSVSISVDGELAKRIVYLDTASGTPAAFSGDISGYILPSCYIYTLDGSVIRSDNDSSWIPPMSYTLEENGNWREESTIDGRPVTKIYSPEGWLLSAEGSGVVEEYRYSDDGTLLSAIERRGRQSKVTRYAEGKAVSVSTYDGSALQSVRSDLDDGSIEEIRYEDGKPRARIIFDSDGLRIREVENLR